MIFLYDAQPAFTHLYPTPAYWYSLSMVSSALHPHHEQTMSQLSDFEPENMVSAKRLASFGKGCILMAHSRYLWRSSWVVVEWHTARVERYVRRIWDKYVNMFYTQKKEKRKCTASTPWCSLAGRRSRWCNLIYIET